jgi:hypothetical protein
MGKHKSKFLQGKRIDPAPIEKNVAVADLIDEAFLAYNAARMREACHLFTQKMLEPEVTVVVSVDAVALMETEMEPFTVAVSPATVIWNAVSEVVTANENVPLAKSPEKLVTRIENWPFVVVSPSTHDAKSKVIVSFGPSVAGSAMLPDSVTVPPPVHWLTSGPTGTSATGCVCCSSAPTCAC